MISDYHLRYTPSFHGVRRVLAPLHVILAIEKGQVRIYGTSEATEAHTLTSRYGMFGLAGGYPLDGQRKVVLLPNTSVCVADLPVVILGADDVSFAVLSDGE